MTRRILLTLAEDTTSTHCGKCRRQFISECTAFRTKRDSIAKLLRKDALGWKRLPECLAAEREAERLGEAKR